MLPSDLHRHPDAPASVEKLRHTRGQVPGMVSPGQLLCPWLQKGSIRVRGPVLDSVTADIAAPVKNRAGASFVACVVPSLILGERPNGVKVFGGSFSHAAPTPNWSSGGDRHKVATIRRKTTRRSRRGSDFPVTYYPGIGPHPRTRSAATRKAND